MSKNQTTEANFDGIVGPTHNYAGLSFGNTASFANKNKVSHPKKAALQGLKKAWSLSERGILQAVLPPHPRPFFSGLQKIGVTDPRKISAPLFANFCSASPMWAANAATVSASEDCLDNKLHITVANLSGNLHRSLEADTTFAILSSIFADKQLFTVHPPLPSTPVFSDEGAANHGRLFTEKGAVNVFVFGKDPFLQEASSEYFPARQTLAASEAVARLHGLAPEKCLFIQQLPESIDAGCFHNDVISVIHEGVLLYHEKAFVDPTPLIRQAPFPIVVKESELSLKEAVSSYLFNSQIVTTTSGMLLVAPKECEKSQAAQGVITKILEDPNNPIDHVLYQDVRESMANGGGPACLRLRVPLTEKEKQAIQARVWLDKQLFAELNDWITMHYREELTPEDLQDPQLGNESLIALQQLYQILQIPMPKNCTDSPE